MNEEEDQVIERMNYVQHNTEMFTNVPKCFKLKDAHEVDFEGISNKFHKDFLKISRDKRFLSCLTFRDQVKFIKSYYPNINNFQIGIFLNTGYENVNYQVKALQKQGHQIGRPISICGKVETELIKYIKQCTQCECPCSYSDIQHYLNFCPTEISINLIRNYILNNPNFEIKLKPIEDSRNKVRQEDMDDYFDRLDATINGEPAVFVINHEEFGFDMFADAKERTRDIFCSGF